MDVLEEYPDGLFEGRTLLGSLSGVQLKITTRYNNEYDYDIHVVKVKNEAGREEYKITGGYTVDIFFYLQALLNFTYIIRPEVSANKLDASALNTSVDLYLASYSILPDRAKYLKPTFATGQSRIYAFIDHAFESDTSNVNIFTNPFTPRLWLCTGIVMTIFFASFLMLNRLEKDSSTGDIIFHCISLSLQRGSDVIYFKDSKRVAGLTLSLAVLVIMASYSGIMTSIFAINRYSINTIEQVISSNYRVFLEVGFNSNQSTIKYMLQALDTVPSSKKLLNKAEVSKFMFASFNNSMEEVSKSPVAYIIDEETGLETISLVYDGFPCSWSKISVFDLVYPWSMYMRKNANFSNEFNSGIIQLRERGILKRIRGKWINNPASTCYGGGDGVTSISFVQIRGLLQLLLITILIVTPFIFLLEKCTMLAITRKKELENEAIFTMKLDKKFPQYYFD